MIFRNIKSVRSIRLCASEVGAEHELSFQMSLANGITRTSRFRYADCEVLNALFDEDECSSLRAKPKVFSQILDHLRASGEAAVQASAESFSVTSFHKTNFGAAALTMQQQQAELKRHMSTGLTVSLQEFDEYAFRPDLAARGAVVELIFCLKEVHATMRYSPIDSDSSHASPRR